MDPRQLSVLVLLLSTFAAGCASLEHTLQPTPPEWLATHGGTESGPVEARAARLAQPLIAGCHGQLISIHILANDTLTAFSWPNGELFISEGLANALNDDELSAAIAHELGHLLNGGQLQSVVALNGTSSALDIEERADAIGSALLQSQNLPPPAMITMLQKVRSAGGLSAASDRTIAHRIQLLTAQIAAQ